MAEPASPPASPDDFDRHVRRVAPDRWLAARLIGDAAVRTEVLALYALDDELARIPAAVSQPMLGEIRLQWWREAIGRTADGGAPDHPTLATLASALRDGRMARDTLEALIDAREAELDRDHLAGDAERLAWIDATAGGVMALAARLLDPRSDPAHVLHAGQAWGLLPPFVQGGGSGRGAVVQQGSADGEAPPLTASERARTGPPPRPSPLKGGRETVAAALRLAGDEVRRLPVAAFPAVIYATLARAYARGRSPSDLGKRARLLWAAARGRV